MGHFLTHMECPHFDGHKSKIARNCPKINFAFDQKIPNSKTKVKNDPLKSKITFSPTRSVWIEIFILRNYLRNCPRIIFAFDHDFQNSKIKLKNYPLKSKNRKKASNHKMSENRPSPNMPTNSKQLSEFSKLKNETKKLPLKIQKTKKSFKSQNVRKLT